MKIEKKHYSEIRKKQKKDHTIAKSFWDTIAPILGSAAGVALAPFTAGTSLALGPLAGGAIGAGIGSGLSTGIQTGDPLKGLVSGAASGLGSYAGGELLGPSLSGIGSSVNAVSGAAEPGLLGSTIGDTFGNFAGNSLGSQTLGTAAGSAVGSSLGGSVGNASMGLIGGQPDLGGTGVPGFSPSKQPSLGLPQSLSQFGNLDPNQQATNIASKGVYGGGNGPQEQNYFLNLINRQLFDQSGNVAQNTNGLAPIDMSYLNQLGISGSNPTDYLKGISQFAT